MWCETNFNSQGPNKKLIFLEQGLKFLFVFGFWDPAETRCCCGVIGTNVEEEELSGEEIGDEEEMSPKLREGKAGDCWAYS